MLLPDFLQQVAEGFSNLFTINTEEPFKTGAKLVSMIGTLVTIGVVVVTKTVPWIRAKRDSRSISKSVGAKIFSVAGIERSLRYYIPPFCQSVDPAAGEESRLIHSVQSKLFDTFDNILNRNSPERYHILLADSGMGKTSALLNYYAHHLRRFRKDCKLEVVPLGISDSDAIISAVSDKENTAIFLDAFDEDTLAMVDHVERLRELLEHTKSFYRVLITSRTQFFARDEEIPKETGIMKVAARGAGESAEFVFYKIYLTPFTDSQVSAYLKRRYPVWQPGLRRKAFAMAQKIPHLTFRPMLLAHIDDLVKSDRAIQYSFQLYETMVDAWLKREHGFIDDPEELRRFSETLAIDLYINRQNRGSEMIAKGAMLELAKRWRISILDDRLSGRSLLNRDAAGNFKFAHRSIMEYLFIKRFTEGELASRNIEWTDNMKRFLVEMFEDEQGEPYGRFLRLDGADLMNLKGAGFEPRRRLRLQDRVVNNDEFEQLVTRSASLDERANRFSTSSLRDQTVLFDWTHGLMWEQSGSEIPLSSAQAYGHCQKLNQRRFYGHDDWRLPTLEEALLGYDVPKISVEGNPSGFDPRQKHIWTSDRYPGGASYNVLLNTTGGRETWVRECLDTHHGTMDAFVRAVRSENPQSPFASHSYSGPPRMKLLK